MKLDYTGYTISISEDNGPVHITPSREKVAALLDFPQPKNKTELRRYLGCVNQLTNFIPNIQPAMKNLSMLTASKCLWLWREIHTEEFNNSKTMLSNAISLATFSFDRSTFVMTDASKDGIAYLMYQTDEDDMKYVICLGSTSLKLRHSLLSPIDLECLSVSYAIGKLEFY